jgi:hypothetical protein
MRRRSKYGGVASVLLATLPLTACVPSEADAVGRWESAEGAVVAFADDGTFRATGLGPHVLLVGVKHEGVPDDLAGTWYVESPFEDVCDEGEAIKINWTTEPVQYADAFCLVERGSDAVLFVPRYQDQDFSAYLEFMRE